MGLDITAYENLKMVENPQLDEDGCPVNWDSEWMAGASMEWSESVRAGRGEGVDPKAVYTYENEFGFRAGSYIGYNWWRNKLEAFAEGNSFQELINFADNEGVIGSVVSSKLYNDFSNNLEKAEAYSKTLGVEGEWWFKNYQNWMKAFDMASQNGAVDFH